MHRLIFIFIATINFFLNADDVRAQDCASIEDGKKRLACYDSFYKLNEPAKQNKSDQPKPERLSSYKDSSPNTIDQNQESLYQKFKNFGFKQSLKKETKDRIDDEISSLSYLRDKRVVIRLKNGQSWRSIKAVNRDWFEGVNIVSITKQAEKSFILRSKTKNGFIRVKRIE